MATNDIEMLISWQDDREKQEYIYEFRRTDGTIEKVILKYDDVLKYFEATHTMDDVKYFKEAHNMNNAKERGSVLDEAKAIINGARQDQYGNPEDSFETIGDFWSAYIRNKMRMRCGILDMSRVDSKDVALMMALMKIAREMHGAGKEDNMIDAAGYIGLAADMSNYNNKEDNND